MKKLMLLLGTALLVYLSSQVCGCGSCKADAQISTVNQSINETKSVKLKITGMTCASCEEHVKHAVNQLPGIVSVSANSEEGIDNVKFDNSKTDKATITKAIDETGYKVSGEITKDNPVHGEVGHVCIPNGCK